MGGWVGVSGFRYSLISFFVFDVFSFDFLFHFSFFLAPTGN